MKKIAILILCAAAALTACQKSLLVPETQSAPQELTFNINVQCGDDTRATKSAWDYGDMIYIFFDNEFLPSAPSMDLTYGPSGWTPYLSQELKDSLANRTSGTLNAVYVPFFYTLGAGYSPESNSYFLEFDDLVWNTSYELMPYGQNVYSYFMTSENTSYSITSGTLSATLTMTFPADKDFVHFWIPSLGDDLNPARYQLSVSPPIPSAGVSGLDANGFQTTSNEIIPGYFYNGGSSFCGVLPAALKGVAQNYTFTLRDLRTDHLYSYSVSGKTLTRGSAVVLPSLTSWIDVGTAIDKVPMYAKDGNLYYFATKNLGARRPEEPGLFFAWGETQGYTLKEVKVGGLRHFSENEYALRVSGNYDDIKFSRYVPATSAANWGGAGDPDDLHQLVPGDDPASQIYGMPWRTPTRAELIELYNQCDWEYDPYQFGYTVTGRGDFASSKIFIPIVDNISNDSYFITNRSGSLLAGDLYQSTSGYDPIWVNHLQFYGENTQSSSLIRTTGSHRRYMGFNLRPVLVVPAS